jgi:hypothetical protein
MFRFWSRRPNRFMRVASGPSLGLLSRYNPDFVLHVSCSRCWRKGRYRVAGLAARHGWDISMTRLLFELSMSCGRHPDSEHRVGRRNERCGAYFPDLMEAP